MRQYIPVITLAMLVALAAAALSGGLLPAGNAVYAVDPVFDSGDNSRSVPENTPPGTNIGDPISATDADEGDLEFGDTLTYSLEATADTDTARAEAAAFDIDKSTGQLITKAALHFDGTNVKIDYSVTVTVEDSRGDADDIDVGITVTDVDEPPAAPMAPTVVSGPDTEDTNPNESTTSLKVVWHVPENTGPSITGYEVQYKKATETSFSNWRHTGTGRIATITDRVADTSYQVRVRATNGEADTTENWSLVGTGSTNKAGNKPPAFIDTANVVTRDVDENEEAGQDVGRPVRATDDGVLPLTYGLGGPDADLFDFNPSSSQIRTKRGVTYNHEDPACGYVDTAATTECNYYVTVTALDGLGGSDAKAVMIEVEDVLEAPGVPRRITVRATEKDGRKNSRSLDVSWNEPENMGPPITGYDVRYRQGSSGAFTTEQATGTTFTIAPMDANLNDSDDRLTPGAPYEVYVRAKTNELNSQFSARATGRTSAGNRQPKFNARPDQENRRPEFANAGDDTRVVNRDVNENTPAGQRVGGAVSANDRDRLTYKLIAVDSPDEGDFNKFGINESTGQILTKEPLNHEDPVCGYIAPTNPSDPTTCTYGVQVQVWDGLDEHGNEEAPPVVDDIIKVTIAVVEGLESPLSPTVTVTSPHVGDDQTTATLIVIWYKPENTGPPLTSYEVECSGAGITTAKPCPQPTNPSLTDEFVSHTIGDLTPNSSYQVRVRAVNDEGEGAWSIPVRQSTSKAGNVIPFFTPTPESPIDIAENTRAGHAVGSPITGDNTDGNLRVSYHLRGPDAGLFTIDGTGQIKTKSPLNFEDEACGYDGTPNTPCTYKVRVKASDNEGGSIVSDEITINVTNVGEPPSAPAPPGVTATKDSGWSLEVTWSKPRNTGPAITDYDIRYRKVGDAVWQDWPHGTADSDTDDNTDRSAKITRRAPDEDADPLEPLTQYEVEVRAKNGEEDTAANWSSRPGRGTTGKSNKRPTFVNTASLVTLRVDENTRSGQNVGGAVEATDTDRNTLTYSLEGPGKDSFTIVSSSGQIRTRAALNHEERSSYSLTVKVDDRQRRDNSVAVKSVAIIVEDVHEGPSAPSAPRVTGIAGSTDSVRVTWEEPANTGPPIIDYDVRCLDCPGDVVHDGADRSTIITGLTPGTRYAVEVRANNGELTGEYSRSGTGSPNPDVANQKPVFSPSGARSFEIAENASTGDPIGSPVTAVDPDLDPVTHTLEGADATSFDIDPGSGQIRANVELDHEEKSRHSVTVKATDTRGGSATVGVTINVTDIAEPPDTPLEPTVTGVSSTSVQVSWDAPENTGPPITDYDYQYQGPSDLNWTEVTNTTITDTTVTISGLTPSTFYDVEVRATNAEGTSEWSNPGIGSTNTPGANNLPVFSEGASATRSVSASAPTGTLIGAPVTATDADSGDTLTYSLEGRDAANFDIDPANGQLRTRTGITLIVGETYTLTVAADDGMDIARIAVSIEAIAGPPNNPPLFTEGASAARTVSATAPAGTPIGVPLTATDADAGTTLTYSLEGADAASFGINTANGQLLTLAGVTLDRSTYIVDVVASDGSATSRITVTITVTPNRAPVFSEGGSATRSVAENAAGANVGSPVSATDRDQGDTLTYTLSGADAASFDIVSTSGQIRTSATLDYETKASYVVTVTATDRSLASASIVVTISVIQVAVNDCAGGGAVADAANNRGLVSDCDALLSARNTLEGRARLDWSESTPIEQWEGVSISGTPMRVTRLNLMDRGLSGTIPASLGRLSMLTHLNLRTNPGLSGEIPDALGDLRNLRLLNLHSNSHTGAVPDLRRIAGLEELYLANNADYNADDSKVRNSGLTGRIPTWLNGMTNMRELWLWGNSLTGTVPNLSGMTSLVKLKLANNNLTGGVPQASTLPPNMTWLIIDRNPFRGTIPNLSSLSRLRLLWLHNNGLTGEIPAGTMFPASVDDLNLRDNMLTGAIPDLSSLDMATRVRLHGNMLTGEVPASLGRLDSLKQLWLWENDLTSINAGLGDLADTLIEIGLEGNPWNANACVPESLANVTTNDYTAAGIDVCDGS